MRFSKRGPYNIKKNRAKRWKMSPMESNLFHLLFAKPTLDAMNPSTLMKERSMRDHVSPQ